MRMLVNGDDRYFRAVVRLLLAVKKLEALELVNIKFGSSDARPSTNASPCC